VIFRQDVPSRYRAPVSPSRRLARSALPRERFRCVLGMLSSLEVKVLRPTWWRWRASKVQGLPPRGGVWRKHQANARVDGQKPNTRREHRTSGQRTVKSISINGAKRRFGDCARKAAELTPGDLLCVAAATESAVRRSDRRAEVSRGHIRSCCRQR